MIHHLILMHEGADLRLVDGMLTSCSKKIALQVLGSVRSFAARATWS